MEVGGERTRVVLAFYPFRPLVQVSQHVTNSLRDAIEHRVIACHCLLRPSIGRPNCLRAQDTAVRALEGVQLDASKSPRRVCLQNLHTQDVGALQWQGWPQNPSRY